MWIFFKKFKITRKIWLLILHTSLSPISIRQQINLTIATTSTAYKVAWTLKLILVSCQTFYRITLKISKLTTVCWKDKFFRNFNIMHTRANPKSCYTSHLIQHSTTFTIRCTVGYLSTYWWYHPNAWSFKPTFILSHTCNCLVKNKRVFKKRAGRTNVIDH